MDMRVGIDIGSTTVKIAVLDAQDNILFKAYERHYSKVREKAAQMLHRVEDLLQGHQIHVAVTGSAGLGVAKTCNLEFVQEVFATAGAIDHFLPDTDVVVELGGEDAKIIFFQGGLEERMNGSCAGGTGAFIDQMATLLAVTPDELDELSEGYEKFIPSPPAAACLPRPTFSPCSIKAPAKRISPPLFFRRLSTRRLPDWRKAGASRGKWCS